MAVGWHDWARQVDRSGGRKWNRPVAHWYRLARRPDADWPVRLVIGLARRPDADWLVIGVVRRPGAVSADRVGVRSGTGLVGQVGDRGDSVAGQELDRPARSVQSGRRAELRPAIGPGGIGPVTGWKWRSGSGPDRSVGGDGPGGGIDDCG